MAQVENLKIGNTSYEINDKKAVHVVDTLPTPSAALVGKVYFAKGYAGSGTENSFFLCESKIVPSFEITYTEAIDDVEITDPKAFYDVLDAAFHEHEGQSLGDGESGLTVFYDDNISPVWRLTKNEWSDFEVIIEAEDLPGVTITGTKTDHSIFVVTYHDQDEYSWLQVKSEVINALDSTSETKALSAYMGNVLAERIDNIGTIGRFLAMWDADTGIARYLDVDFEYERGDYFIVASVAGEGGVNYMPNGDTYTGPSTTIATDDLRLSDMYYYDGTHWVYMANHEKQIAVDETLDTASVNPVQNRVIANRVNSIETTLDEKQDTLVSGTNIKTINGNSILGEGNIEVKGGGSAGLPTIATVDIKPYSYDKNLDRYNTGAKEWRGFWEDIVFTTNMDRDTLIANMHDLYVGMLRYHRTGYTKKYELDDGDRFYKETKRFGLLKDKGFRSTKVMHCWVYTSDWESGEVDPVEQYNEGTFNPTQWQFFYIEDSYDSYANLAAADPEVYSWWGEQSNGTRAHFMNILRDSGLLVTDVSDNDFPLYRMPMFDVDEVINKDRYIYKSYLAPQDEGDPEEVIGNRWECCECTNSDGEKLFAWCNGWNFSGAGSVLVDIERRTNYIPERFEIDVNVELIDKSEFLAEHTVGKKRPDLDITHLSDESIDSILGSVNMGPNVNLFPLWKTTDEEKPEGATERGSKIFRNQYYFDHPIRPVLLADCEVFVEDTYKDPDVGGTISGHWIKFKDYINLDQSKLSTEHILFKYPYPTDYIWLRFTGWEKDCVTHPYYEDYGVWMKDSFAEMMARFTEEGNPSIRCMEGKPTSRSMSDAGRYTERVEFNLFTADDIVSGKISQATPVRKRLIVIPNNNKMGLTD